VESVNPFYGLRKSITCGDKQYNFYDMMGLKDERYRKLPYSIRVLLESAVRNCDNFSIKK